MALLKRVRRSGRAGVLLIAAIIVGAGSSRAQQTSPVPAAITLGLNARYPGWTFPTVSPSVAAKFKGKAYLPNVIFGDYDGDRRRDYAVRILTGKAPDLMQMVIAFMSKGQTFEVHALNSLPEDPSTYLWPAAKGEEAHDYDSDKDFVYANDAIMFLIDEKAGVSFVWERTEFRMIVTSD
jgi:hypothetical protein